MKKNQNKKDSKKVRKNNNIMIIIIVLMVIILGIIFVSIKIKNNKQNNEQNNTQEETDEFNLNLIDMNNTENAEIKDGIKENNSQKLLAEREVQELQITDIRLKAENGISNFTATVKNNSGKDYPGGEIIIKFINKDGSPYAELEAYMPDVKNGGTNTIDASTTADIANAYDYTIEVKQ